MRSLLHLLPVLLLSFVQAQTTDLFSENKEPYIQLEEKQYDFGMIEEGPEYTHCFIIKNVSADTLKLSGSNVRSGCGCVLARLNKLIFAPGDTGHIRVTFNSMGRVGVFFKQIHMNYKEQNTVVYIKGVVFAKDTATYTTAQLTKSAIGKLDINAYDFGEMEKGRSDSIRIKIYNTGKDTLQILNAIAGCGCISYKLYYVQKNKPAIETAFIPPGKSGYIDLKYHPLEIGKTINIFTLQTNDKAESRKAIRLSALVKSTTR